ncbi:hypothetical protein AC1031_020709 [Aphanomyces cochlioides]|nr:hypothetical protein AC1031_020709 [Aphanomyces cochlioides]
MANADIDATSSQQYETTGRWTRQEHELFLKGIQMFPNGPWKYVAAIVKTRTVRQLRTHAQKYRAKMAKRHQQRHMRCSLMAESHHATTSTDELGAKIEPIQFTDTTVQYDECIEFLIDALGDDLQATGASRRLYTHPFDASSPATGAAITLSEDDKHLDETATTQTAPGSLKEKGHRGGMEKVKPR